MTRADIIAEVARQYGSQHGHGVYFAYGTPVRIDDVVDLVLEISRTPDVPDPAQLDIEAREHEAIRRDAMARIADLHGPDYFAIAADMQRSVGRIG